MFSIHTLARPLALTAAAGLLIALPACSAAEDPVTAPTPAASAPDGTPSSSPSTSAPSTSATSVPTGAAGHEALLAAGELGAQEVSDGTVVSIEAEPNGWEVHVVTADGAEQELLTDSAGTAVVSGPTDDRPDADDRAENQQFAQVKVDYRDAVEVIEGAIDGGQIDEASLDLEDNRILWEADVSVGSEQRTVQLDADTGEVVSNRLDD